VCKRPKMSQAKRGIKLTVSTVSTLHNACRVCHWCSHTTNPPERVENLVRTVNHLTTHHSQTTDKISLQRHQHHLAWLAFLILDKSHKTCSWCLACSLNHSQKALS
jgi:hypothetical protein